MDSDFVPDRGFSPFPDKTEEKTVEGLMRAEIAQKYDVLVEILEHFDQSIDHYQRTNTSQLDLTLRPKHHAIATRANIQTAKFLEAERGYIKGLIDAFKR